MAYGPTTSRPHWRDRVASTLNKHEDPKLPLISQLPSAGATEQPPKVVRPWLHISANLQDLPLDRSYRYLAWQVLHATLPCRALRAYRAVFSLIPTIAARPPPCGRRLPRLLRASRVHVPSLVFLPGGKEGVRFGHQGLEGGFGATGPELGLVRAPSGACWVIQATAQSFGRSGPVAPGDHVRHTFLSFTEAGWQANLLRILRPRT